MKTSFILILSLALLIGCKSGGNTNNADSANMGVSENNSANNTWNQEKISDFVEDATTSSLMEVQLGNIAQKKAMSQQVRDYAKMMVTDHTDASQKLTPVLTTLSITAPTALEKEDQDKIDNLNQKTGKDFDKEYIDKMVNDHKDNVNKFEDAQKNLPSGELRTWVENTLPVLRQHLIQAETLQETLKNQK